MSNFRAVATVTASLQRVLQSAVQADVAGAIVTTVRPGEGAGANLPATGVNLFLYQVSHNSHRGNDDLPTRRSGGEVVQRPVAALDLHYLMSFYGDDLKLEPQRLLGSAMAFLHSQPQLTRAQIQAAAADASKPFLSGADLADQTDLVRFSPMSLTLDELSRLWSVFLQTHYVLSTTFKASPVFLERQILARPALPTRELRLSAVPLRRPLVTRILAAADENTPVTSGTMIAVEGTGLAADLTEVEIDGIRLSVTAAENSRVVLTLPPHLLAGPHTLLVRLWLDPGTPGGPRSAFASNQAAFVVQPVITKTAGNFDIDIGNVQGTASAPRSATITVHVAPDVGTRQTATLELLTPQGVAGTFMAAPRAASTSTLVFSATGVVAGVYLVQLRIDGAVSPLDHDANGVALAPKGTIP